ALSGSPAAAGLHALAGNNQDRTRTLVLGVAICSLLPAVFWCGVIWLTAPLTGFHPSPSGLAAIGSTIALFLTLISSALLAR
ncbi:hypothetical protein ABTN42_22405, partial [Acinetobacter baumannii]